MLRQVNNKHLIVASCWFFLSSYFAHDARSQEPKTGLCVVLFQLKKQQQLQQQILLQHFQAQQAQLAEQHEQQLQQHLKVEVLLHSFVWSFQFIVTEVSETWQCVCRLSNQWTLLGTCKEDRVVVRLIGKSVSLEL